jgi:transcriptional regulator with XRE-family HTH domain
MDGRALVAWNLRRIRVKRGLSQERLAFDSGVDRSYLGGLERGEENPTVDILDRLAKTLSVSISEFFVSPGKGSMPPKPLRSGRLGCTAMCTELSIRGGITSGTGVRDAYSPAHGEAETMKAR